MNAAAERTKKNCADAYFVDAAGRRWTLRVNLTIRNRVLTATDNQVDLFAAADGSVFEKLCEPAALIETLHEMCFEQARKQKVGPEKFAEAIAGDVIEDAVTALGEAIANFFPSRQRLILKQVLANSRRTAQTLSQAAMNILTRPTSPSGSSKPPQSPESERADAHN